MTGEQMTLVLGLIVFGMLVLSLSRARTRTPEAHPPGKSKPTRAVHKRRK
jgi:hypothetical protein